MNLGLISKIAAELQQKLVGSRFRNALQLGDDRFALAFENDEYSLLFTSVKPNDSRTYLIRRRSRDLKKLATHPSQFTTVLNKTLAGAMVADVRQIANDRLIEIELSNAQKFALIVQLTGKSSNLFLLNSERNILASARKSAGDAQQIGSQFAAPQRITDGESATDDDLNFESKGDSLSESLDRYFSGLEKKRELEELAASVKNQNKRQITKLKRLIANLNADLENHGDAEKWKRFGDLLLANQNSAERRGSAVSVKDLFDENAPTIEIEVDENDSFTEAAQKYFRRYTKARNARGEIEKRLENSQTELKKLLSISGQIENAIKNHDAAFLQTFVSKKPAKAQTEKKKKQPELPSGIRTFLSSDEFEILVGKKATDNDFLTFRVAHSRDTWMHAADYPGSHVVIRNANRKEIPHRTLIEAAQLAAFYSQGSKQPKAAVHYTLKKFVNKPRGAALGLVRLASFKTILVEPKIGDAKHITR